MNSQCCLLNVVLWALLNFSQISSSLIHAVKSHRLYQDNIIGVSYIAVLLALYLSVPIRNILPTIQYKSFSFIPSQRDKRSSTKRTHKAQRFTITLWGRLYNSSSWQCKSPNFRQKIRSSYYRNGSIKYDLKFLRRRGGLISTNKLTVLTYCKCFKPITLILIQWAVLTLKEY